MGRVKNTSEDFAFFNESNSGTDQYVDRSFEITDRILEIIKDTGISQKSLAEKMGKSESEVSKWLCGTHNFTIKTLSKLEVAIGKSIFIPVNGEEFGRIANQQKSFSLNPGIIIWSKDLGSGSSFPYHTIESGKLKDETSKLKTNQTNSLELG